ncbi:MAG TPA: ABC transporter permease [Chloroflexota bacterium]|nr:ABC transporter permease [Chloroflexota bacterium]HUM68713.1 ABC transporter permease [Chloroflexota bacterium]
MNANLVSAIVVKDLSLYFRNRFFAFVTILGLVFYAIIYYALPATVDETVTIGVYAPAIPPAFLATLAEEGVVLQTAVTEDALLQAMEDGDYNIGVVVSDNLLTRLAAQEQDDIILYFTPDFPQELHEAYAVIFQELAYNMVGQPLTLNVRQEILGTDMVGSQIALRDQLIPMLVVVILLIETLGLAALVSSEIEGQTIQALLVTPLTIPGLFTGKGIMGVGLAFTQVTLLMLVTRSLGSGPLLLLFTLLLGSMLVTGLGFLIASVARDLMGVMSWGMLAIVIFTIPAFTAVVPGLVSDWVKIIPSYYIVDTLYQVMNFGVGWADVASNLVALLAFALLFFGLGILALWRKFR